MTNSGHYSYLNYIKINLQHMHMQISVLIKNIFIFVFFIKLYKSHFVDRSFSRYHVFTYNTKKISLLE